MTAGVGTLLYLAPEVLEAEDDPNSRKTAYNKAADIYGLAMILHELFGGGTSFFPTPEGCDPRAKFMRIYRAKSEREMPQLKLELLPSAMTDVVRRGVDTDPSKRPSLEEFVAAIKEA
jgi:serine/threonine protein kinase